MRLQAGVGFCGASDVKALRYRATQHIHKVTHRDPVFRVMIRARIKRDHVFRPNEITRQDRRISRDDPLPRGPNATRGNRSATSPNAQPVRPQPDFRVIVRTVDQTRPRFSPKRRTWQVARSPLSGSALWIFFRVIIRETD